MDKKRVAIIGKTDSVGQEFVQSLNNYPSSIEFFKLRL